MTSSHVSINAIMIALKAAEPTCLILDHQQLQLDWCSGHGGVTGVQRVMMMMIPEDGRLA